MKIGEVMEQTVKKVQGLLTYTLIMNFPCRRMYSKQSDKTMNCTRK